MSRLTREWPVDVRAEARRAERRIRKHIRKTPLERSLVLSRISGGDVYLKLENLQVSGSFKVRGVLNKLLSFDRRRSSLPLITASTGNHGAAFTHAARMLGLSGTVLVPKTASPVKVEALRSLEANLELFGTDCVESETEARRRAETSGMTFISPYNDPQIIGGQATVALELEGQMDRIDSVFVPLGGGGLASGVAGCLKARGKAAEVIGCQPKNSPVMHDSIRAGRIVERRSLPTLSDGTAGGIEPGSITFDLCRRLLDDIVLVEEEEIRQAVRLILERHHLLIEGAAALAVSAFLRSPGRYQNRAVVLILTGARIDPQSLQEILS